MTITPRWYYAAGRVSAFGNVKIAVGDGAYSCGRGVITIRADSPRWREIHASEYGHERAGLQQIKSLLPDGDPYHAWANVEFQGADGTVNEVDLLVLLPQGLYILELKHWQG